MIINELRRTLFPSLPQEHFNAALGGVLVLVLTAGGWYGYKTYKTRQSQEAQQALSGAMEEFHQALGQSKSWEDVGVVADINYRRHASSWAAPYLLSLEAYAIEQEGNTEGALVIWDKILKNINESNPFWFMFATKRATLQTQSSELSLQQEGIKQLTDLSNNENNIFRDQALYFLGFFEPSAWRELERQFWQTDSPWLDLLRNS